MRKYKKISNINLPVLTDGQLYIYVIQNHPQGNIKIGKSTDVKTRMTSLSGSNNGGNTISKIAVSKATYLYTIERILHDHFKHARIAGTEWFDGEKLVYDDVCKYVDKLFKMKSYQTCNQVREQYTKEQRPIIAEIEDEAIETEDEAIEIADPNLD